MNQGKLSKASPNSDKYAEEISKALDTIGAEWMNIQNSASTIGKNPGNALLMHDPANNIFYNLNVVMENLKNFLSLVTGDAIGLQKLTNEIQGDPDHDFEQEPDH